MVVDARPLPPRSNARAHQKHSTIKFLTCINRVYVAAHYARAATNNEERRFIMKNVRTTLAIAAISAISVMGLGLLAGHAHAAEQGSWLLRARAVNIDPVDKSDPIAGVGASDRISVSKKTIPEIDLSYFFTPNIAAELVLTYPQKHTVRLDGQDIGSFKHLPPTLTLQYHFLPGTQLSPYLGAGVNYTWFFSQSAAGGTVIESHLKNSFAPVVQFGFDYMIDQHWGWNVDVKKVWLRPNWDGTLAGGVPVTGQVKLDPWLIGTGITYKF
jgi:outer membrane protein